MSKLTAVQVRNAKPKVKPYKLSDGHSLYFHVAKSGSGIRQVVVIMTSARSLLFSRS